MLKRIVKLAAALSCLSAIASAPASAQTQGQSYAFGRADFCRGYVESHRAISLWLTGPDLYERIYGSPRLPRPVTLDCDRRAFRHDHHGLSP